MSTDTHGIGAVGIREIDPGALLDRLEQKGLVASRLDQATPERGGHPRRYFKVTALGLKRVRHAVAMLDKMRAGLDPILAQP